jgi:hypothetical protein
MILSTRIFYFSINKKDLKDNKRVQVEVTKERREVGNLLLDFKLKNTIRYTIKSRIPDKLDQT